MDLWGNEDEDEYRARKRAEIFSSSYHSRITECWKTPSIGAGSALFAMRAAAVPCCLPVRLTRL